jgi:hypothetical protein
MNRSALYFAPIMFGLMASIGCGGIITIAAPEGYCQHHTDCQAGQVCIDHQCTDLPADYQCATEADCPDDYACVSASCLPFIVPECASDQDCSSPLVCQNGLCVETPPQLCGSDDECQAGLICHRGECIEVPPDSHCLNDADCAAGYICHEGGCVLIPPDDHCFQDSDCAEGQICHEAVCVAAPQDNHCLQDADCATDQICHEAVCVPVPADGHCLSDDACTEPQLCIHGNCVAPPDTGSCFTDADCPQGQVCNGDACLPPQPVGGGCREDADCAEGLVCTDGLCAEPPPPDGDDDGIPDSQDKCPGVPGSPDFAGCPSAIDVTLQQCCHDEGQHESYGCSDPHMVCQPVAGDTAYAFPKGDGACARQFGCGHEHYADIVANCAPTASGQTDANGFVRLDLTPGDYLVIVVDQASGQYAGKSVYRLQDGKSRAVSLRIAGACGDDDDHDGDHDGDQN